MQTATEPTRWHQKSKPLLVSKQCVVKYVNKLEYNTSMSSFTLLLLTILLIKHSTLCPKKVVHQTRGDNFVSS